MRFPLEYLYGLLSGFSFGFLTFWISAFAINALLRAKEGGDRSTGVELTDYLIVVCLYVFAPLGTILGVVWRSTLASRILTFLGLSIIAIAWAVEYRLLPSSGPRPEGMAAGIGHALFLALFGHLAFYAAIVATIHSSLAYLRMKMFPVAVVPNNAMIDEQSNASKSRLRPSSIENQTPRLDDR